MIFAALVRKEWLEIVRDPITLAVAIFLPLVLLFVFGYGISLDVEDVRLGVYDQDRTQASKRLVEAFTAGGYFRVTRRFSSPEDATEALDRGQVTVALVIPPDYSRLLAADRVAPVQLLIDGSFSATALSATLNSSSVPISGRCA